MSLWLPSSAPTRSQTPYEAKPEGAEAFRPSYLHIPDVRRRQEVADPMEAKLMRVRSSLRKRLGVDAAHELGLDFKQLELELDEHLRRSSLPATVAVHVRELASGHVVYDNGGDTILVPASTAKLVTAAAALELLGADYRHKTLVWLDGDALVIEGRGDPTMRREDLEEIADSVAAIVDLSAVRRIMLDDTAFTAQLYEGEMFLEGDGEAFRAPSSALALQFNTVEIAVSGTRFGAVAQVELLPATSEVVFTSSVRTSTETNLRATSRALQDGRTHVAVWGSVGVGRVQSLWRAVAAPTMFLGHAFAARLEVHRLASPLISPPLIIERGRRSEFAQLLFENESEPLADQVRTMLAYSNNFYAEQILRTLAFEVLGQPGDWEGGRKVIAGYWNAIGIEANQLHVVNGSGLTRTGGITARALVDLLEVGSEDSGSVLASLLPENNEDGTLRGRLPRYAGRVRAKTGTLDGVSGLAGLIERRDGAPVMAFAILINIRPGARVAASTRRGLEDALIATVIEELDRHD